MLKKNKNLAKLALIFSISALIIFLLNPIQYFICKVSHLNGDQALASTQYNYGEALQKAIYFYDAQRSGKLPENNRVEWRGDSGLKDGSDQKLDLTGGWYDAGDHMKFGLPMASSTTLLSWGVIEYEDAYKKSGQYNYMLDNLRWVNDYFIKAHPSPNVFWGQVGKGGVDHAWWGPAEVMPMERPAYKIDESCPGSDLVGETAAAMAASSIVFKKVDSSYSATLLRHAKELYDFADKYRGNYSDCITDAKEFYKSQSGYEDELVWAAAWLHRATNDPQYLAKAEQYYDNLADRPDAIKSYNWTHTWDDKSYGTYVLLAELTGKEKYIQDTERWLNYWCDRCNRKGVHYTPGGLAWLNEWGSLRYVAKTAFLAFIYGDVVKDAKKQERYHTFAERQVKYMLGSNPKKRSYVVGFGDNPPTEPHHRTAHASWANSQNIPEKTRHTLYGALVGGPDKNDNYIDDRSKFMMTEVALDYNAGFTGAIAKMYSKYGGAPLPDFPPKEVRDDEFFVGGQATAIADKSTEVSATIYNQSAWPARIVPKLSFRYFIDLSEGGTPEEVEVKLDNTKGASISTLKPWDVSKKIYYVQVDLDSSKIYPGGEQYYKKEVKFRLTNPKSAWNPENDWSYQDVKDQSTPVKSEKIPVYDNGRLIFGKEPGKSAK